MLFYQKKQQQKLRIIHKHKDKTTKLYILTYFIYYSTLPEIQIFLCVLLMSGRVMCTW